MSLIIDIFAVIGIMATFTVFWWAMIEAQEQAAAENEKRDEWRKR